MKTKILADSQICISVPSTVFSKPVPSFKQHLNYFFIFVSTNTFSAFLFR